MKAALIACVLLLSLANPAEGHDLNTDNRAEGAAVAQSPSWTKVEHRPVKAEGVGSNPTSGPSSAPHPAIEGGPCNTWQSRILPRMGFEKVHRRVLWLIRCAIEWVHGTPGGFPMAECIATRESGPFTWPWAVNPSGSTGVFQWISSTWEGVRARYRWLASMTSDSRFSARSNVLFFARVAHNEGLGAWGGGCS